MSARTDVHRPGAIIPADYAYVRSYHLSTTFGGWPIPSFGVNCEMEKHPHHESGMCRTAQMARTLGSKMIGGTGRCTVCGVHFVYGDVWMHKTTGDYIHIGHVCADKYSMLADRSDWEMELGRAKARAAVEMIKEAKSEERRAFLGAHPGLEDALTVEHHIIADIRERFTRTATLSEKQVALVQKLAAEAYAPKQIETHVPAPEGRVCFQGTVVSIKVSDGFYGETVKLVVKMETETGATWLCYVTKPASWAFPEGWDVRNSNVERGDTVELTATLKHGRDAHFAIGKRPTGARLVSRPAPRS